MGLARENSPMDEFPSSADSATERNNEPVDALRERVKNAEHVVIHQAVLVNQLAELLSANSLETAIDAMANALQTQFSCDRVAVALFANEKLELKSVSQQAVLQTSTSESRLLIDAMREACDREAIIAFPAEDDALGVQVAHRALAGPNTQTSLCSVPLYEKEELIGAFLLERTNGNTFPIKTLEHLSVCIAPLIALRQQADSGVLKVIKRRTINKLAGKFGVDRPGSRILGLLAVGAIAASVVVQTHWEIVGNAELLPQERRLVTASQTGFLSQTLVVAGEEVRTGQLLAKLDRREVELDVASRDSEVAVAEAEFRAAMASYDRQETGIARARLAQARARRDAIGQRLDRTELVSPIDGLVIAADPSRTSGAAVTRGETLFEIAPSDDYEVHILINEADIHDVSVGQKGELSLRSSPGNALAITVSAIHPVAEVADGSSQFRVRASLTDPLSSLRPGQSGVARLEGGTSNVLSVLTRKLNRRLAELWWRFIG